MTPERAASLLEEVVGLREKYPEMHLKFRDGAAVLAGTLEFRARREEIQICDSYEVDIRIPNAYPSRPPVIREVGGKIPRHVDHHVQPDGTLCLGPPIEVFSAFKQRPTLLWYVEGIVIPCLYWHSYNAQHPEDPLPAYSHGFDGIAEYRAETDLHDKYFVTLEVNQLSAVLGLLRIACQGEIDGTVTCPCGSGRPLAVCHASVLSNLLAMPYLSRAELARDYWHLKDKDRKPRRTRIR